MNSLQIILQKVAEGKMTVELKSGHSQLEISKKIGCSQTYVSYILRGIKY